MTRIYYHDDDWGIEAILASGRWQRNTIATLKSKRGQQALREIEQALLALPQPHLEASKFCEVDAYLGEVNACVLGAYAHHKRIEIPEWLNDEDDGNADETALWAEDALGLTFTLAWNLIERNDERYGRLTPEERYAFMLGWIREQLIDTAEVVTQ